MISAAIASGLRTASTSAPARSSVTTMRRSWSRSLEIASTRRFDKVLRAQVDGPRPPDDIRAGRLLPFLVLICHRQIRAEPLVGVGEIFQVRLVVEEHVGLVGMAE